MNSWHFRYVSCNFITFEYLINRKCNYSLISQLYIDYLLPGKYYSRQGVYRSEENWKNKTIQKKKKTCPHIVNILVEKMIINTMNIYKVLKSCAVGKIRARKER